MALYHLRAVSSDQEFKEVLKTITQNMEKARLSKGLTQKDVAFECGMEEQNYRRIEKGLSSPSLRSLVRIAKALGLKVEDLFK